MPRLGKFGAHVDTELLQRPQLGLEIQTDARDRPYLGAVLAQYTAAQRNHRHTDDTRGGSLGARALLEPCSGMSPSVLYERLTELNVAGLIAKNDAGEYTLTELGAQLGAALEPLDRCRRRWATRSL